MATQEQIAEAMNAMQRRIAELASQLAEERHRSANLDRVAQVLDGWTTQQAQQPVARLVDTRRIGRPSNFGSGEEKSLEKSFPVWERKMQNYIISVFPDLREPLEWAATTAVPITRQLVEQRFGSQADPTDQVMDLEDKMCRSIMHYTSYLRTKDCTNNGYVMDMLEHNIDTGVHMISHNTQT